MRTRFFALSLLTFFCSFTSAYGSSLRDVELIDGSVIRAQVLSMDGKTYRLRSETLGDVEIPEYRVKAIRGAKAKSAPTQSDKTSATTQQWQPETAQSVTDTGALPSSSPPAVIPSTNDLQQAFSQDPAAMNSILSMRDDPLVQSILSDERLMQAIHSGNLGELMNDPKIRELMSHPTVRGLGRQYGR
ncbi:MAG: hypothetical protein FJ147_10860 [Deltaproteobacteria bacterium]|nr:hypothetical protein [Deltaproteobacteria bacterium]